MILALDLGGTKLALALFSEDGKIMNRQVIGLNNRQGKEVGILITTEIEKVLTSQNASGRPVQSVGIAVPGISRNKTGTVWAPNIAGWEDYPLLREVRQAVGPIPVIIDSDRACYISGEVWRGNARGCKNAIYLAVGTGIGAGILVNGHILRGENDIAGAVGWMALDRPFHEKYVSCGCFEYHASGEGIAKVAKEFLLNNEAYVGELKKMRENITAHDVFAAYENRDVIATSVITESISYWGMAIANLVSVFNPEKIILGGGVFGPALQFIQEIRKEASKWGQPISMTQVILESSMLGNDAGLYGAGFLASQQVGN